MPCGVLPGVRPGMKCGMWAAGCELSGEECDSMRRGHVVGRRATTLCYRSQDLTKANREKLFHDPLLWRRNYRCCSWCLESLLPLYSLRSSCHAPYILSTIFILSSTACLSQTMHLKSSRIDTFWGDERNRNLCFIARTDLKIALPR